MPPVLGHNRFIGREIRKNEKGWFARLAAAYKARESVILVDDAKVGINPKSQNLVTMGIQAGLSPAD